MRFTKDELSDLTKKARKARLTNAAFIRCAVCGAEVREAPPADVPLLIGEVRRVAYIPDISCNRAFVEELAHRCNEEQLSPMHLLDVVLDALS